jgi:hypothetical protein
MPGCAEIEEKPMDDPGEKKDEQEKKGRGETSLFARQCTQALSTPDPKMTTSLVTIPGERE